jgi:hypothetical protein
MHAYGSPGPSAVRVGQRRKLSADAVPRPPSRAPFPQIIHIAVGSAVLCRASSATVAPWVAAVPLAAMLAAYLRVLHSYATRQAARERGWAARLLEAAVARYKASQRTAAAPVTSSGSQVTIPSSAQSTLMSAAAAARADEAGQGSASPGQGAGSAAGSGTDPADDAGTSSTAQLQAQRRAAIAALQTFVVADIVAGVLLAMCYAGFTMPHGQPLPGVVRSSTAGLSDDGAGRGRGYPWYLYYLECLPNLAEAAGAAAVLGALLVQRSLALEERRTLVQRLELARIVAAAETAQNDSRRRFMR